MGYFDTLLRYFEFSGRSTRRQYWGFHLGFVLLAIAAVISDHELLGHRWSAASRELGPLTLFVVLVHTWPGVTVTVRRLHDTARSGWWYWIGLVPIVGSFILLWFMICGPEYDAQQYGDDPRDQQGSRRAPSMSRADQMLMAINVRRSAAPSGSPSTGRFIE